LGPGKHDPGLCPLDSILKNALTFPLFFANSSGGGWRSAEKSGGGRRRAAVKFTRQSGGKMVRIGKIAVIALGLALLLPLSWPGDLRAYTITEKSVFSQGPYSFQMEIQIHGSGNINKSPLHMTSLKVKIRNERASTAPLHIKTIRAYIDPKVYNDIETRGYPIKRGNWVTKFYRLRKAQQPSLNDQGFIEIGLDGFIVRFSPRQRQFQVVLP
jgi:hypothetical protein